MIKKYVLLTLVSIFGILPVFTTANTDVDNSSETSCAVISVNLRYLSRDVNTNGAVSVLQDFLNANGYLKSQPTGFFGSQTRSAVDSFQKANGLSARPIGYVGPSTRALIKKIDCDGGVSTTPVVNKPGTPVVSLPNQPFAVTFPTSNSVVNIGETYRVSWSGNMGHSSTGEIYRALLEGGSAREGYLLANINASDRSFTWTPKDDLIPGKYKIIFNGNNYGPSSQEFTINSRVNNPTIPTTPTTPVFNGVFNRNLQFGDSGADVNGLVRFLITRGFLGSPADSSDDSFNLQVKTALTQFQASVGISPADGHFGPLTRSYINSNQTTPIVPTTPTTPVVTTPIVTTPVVSSDKCSLVIDGTTYTLNPCSIDMDIIDKTGHKNFSTTIIPSGGNASVYGFNVASNAVGLPEYAISGASSGGTRGNTKLDRLYFNDNFLSSNDSSYKIYSGYLPIHIFHGSEVSDKNYLHLKINLKVFPYNG